MINDATETTIFLYSVADSHLIYVVKLIIVKSVVFVRSYPIISARIKMKKL